MKRKLKKVCWKKIKFYSNEFSLPKDVRKSLSIKEELGFLFLVRVNGFWIKNKIIHSECYNKFLLFPTNQASSYAEQNQQESHYTYSLIHSFCFY